MILLSHERMTADGQSIVAAENDDGVLPLVCSLQRIDYSADLMVKVCDHRIVVTQLLPHARFGPRIWGERFVTYPLLCKLHRVFGHDVGRQRDRAAVVHRTILIGHGARVMGGKECGIAEEGLLFFILLDEFYRGISEQLG